MLIWSIKKAEENLLTLIANASLGNIQKIAFGPSREVYVISEKQYKLLISKNEKLRKENRI